MSILVTDDHTAYRRWVNIIPSLLIPGAGHVLSGRKYAGVLWFLANQGLTAFAVGLVGPPVITTNSLLLIFQAGLVAVWVAMLGDGCRKPIPRLEVKRWLVLVALAVAIPLIPVLTLRQLVIQPFKIPTGAMQPTLMGITKAADGSMLDGDHILVGKMGYWFHEPQRGDIIVFRTRGILHSAVPQNQIYVKRLVGLPGDRVSIRPPFLCINGERLLNPAVFEKIASGSNGFSGYVGAELLKSEQDEVTVGPGELFVLGDNSRNSLDGRYFGPIRRKSVVGKVLWIYAPRHRQGKPE